LIVPAHYARRCVISMRPDPFSIGSAAAILLVTAVAAAVIPTYRARRADPMIGPRCEWS